MKSKSNFKYSVISVIFIITVVSCDNVGCEQDSLRDFDYVLAKDNFHSRQIAAVDSPNLILGSAAPDSTLGHAASLFYCTKQPYDGYTKPYLDTEVKNASQGHNLEFDDYFILITRDVRKCTDRNSQLPAFLRVVNEIMSVKEIGEMNHYDGIEVNVTRYLGERVHAIVLEIKYLMEGTGSIVKYEGCLKLLFDPNLIHQYIPRFKKTEHLYAGYRALPNSHGLSMAKVEMPNGMSAASTPDLTSQSAWSLVVGSPTVIAEPNQPALTNQHICKRVVMPTPYASVFRTEVLQEVDASGTTIHASLDDDLFSQLFVITDRVVHQCIQGRVMVFNHHYYLRKSISII